MRDPACKECDQLWDSYANATFKRIRAQNAVELAKALYAEDGNMETLRAELEQQVGKVEQIHNKIDNHEAAAHNGRPRDASAKQSSAPS
jgi:hypothetical protein